MPYLTHVKDVAPASGTIFVDTNPTRTGPGKLAAKRTHPSADREEFSHETDFRSACGVLPIACAREAAEAARMEQMIDVSELQPPQPMECILGHLADLPPMTHLRVRHKRDPTPIYPMLATMGFHWETRHLGPGQFEILIWPTTSPPPENAS
jgi:hypothetical protein